MPHNGFLFLSATTPWVYALADAVAVTYPAHVVGFYDWLTYRKNRPTWPGSSSQSLLRKSMHVLPTGYAGSMEWLYRVYLQRVIKKWYQQIKGISGKHSWVIAPYPYLAPWVREVPDDQLIYFNLDDYVLYNPSKEKKILEHENELISRSAVTLCLSQSQVVNFQKRHPGKASSIHHYPLGVVETYINRKPRPPQALTVGYVGNLIDRVDWSLIDHVARTLPEVTFVFIGRAERASRSQVWQEIRDAVLALPNVQHVDEVPQNQVAQYYWSFAVNWIPYVVNHPFNQASCPTKIMDGIASLRPVISADIPECRLYPEWINIFHSPDEAIALLSKSLFSGGKKYENKYSSQLAFAEQQTWQHRAKTLEKLLPQQ